MQQLLARAARAQCYSLSSIRRGKLKKLLVTPSVFQQNSRAVQTVVANRSPYEVLNVHKEATLAEIKSAFYSKSKLFHPDVNHHEEAVTQFHEILRAYDILRVPKLRRLLDQGLLDPTDNESAEQSSPAAAEPEEEQRYREYTEAARRRTQRGQVTSGKSEFYNYDEFYRMHYTEVLAQERADRAELRERLRSMQDEENRVERSHQAASTIMIIMGAIYLFYLVETALKRRARDDHEVAMKSRGS